MYVRCMFVLVCVLEVGIWMEEGWLGPGGRTGNNVGFTGDHGGIGDYRYKHSNYIGLDWIRQTTLDRAGQGRIRDRCTVGLEVGS